ncbi:hypothetical protein SGRA_2801 [Saprospira grandis str. Lewin]|uniref:Uncharacterized protein n=1 Tax=Saprospira grandis (strain Lewin) TaxID=984262 RepID=H6LA61_SAPGL|nr:hypothetical protein SGRA_2801 [Saprospira grandis str. Lewin]
MRFDFAVLAALQRYKFLQEVDRGFGARGRP